jgi:hypothetical protein
VSDFTAILAVSQTLRALLDGAISASTDPELPHVPTTLASPKEVHSTTATTTPSSALSLWLYQVRRNPDLLNEPPRRISPDEVLPPALPVDLFYLVTPIYTTTDGEQALLGKVLQTLNDNTIVSGGALAAPLDPGSDQLRVTLEALSLEEITRVWQALDEPYELSVSYHVQLVQISSGLQPTQLTPVELRELAVDEVVGAS